VLLHRLHYALPGWDATVEKRDAQDAPGHGAGHARKKPEQAGQSRVRSMCRTSMWHVQEYRITAQKLEDRLGVQSLGTYLVRRRLRWLGHVRRMPWNRPPRKLLRPPLTAGDGGGSR
jgi:hypothetical protein